MTKDNLKENDKLKDVIIKILDEKELIEHKDKFNLVAVQVKKKIDWDKGIADQCQIKGVYSRGFGIDLQNKLKEEIEKKQYKAVQKSFDAEELFVCEGKSITNEEPKKEIKKKGIEESEYFLILVSLENEIKNYKGIIRFILRRFLGEIMHFSEFEDIEINSERFKSLFGDLHKKRVLLGDYVEFYLQEKKLPDAELLTELSAAKYEGSDSEARIYFDMSAVREACALDKKGKESRVICSEKLRLTRKLMEIAKRNKLFLFAEKQEKSEFLITRLVERKGTEEKGLYIKFSGFMHWGIFDGGKEEITYYQGKYLLNASEKDTVYSAKIKRMLNRLPDEYKKEMGKCFSENGLIELVKILKEQKHGTSVLITNCIDHVNRLCDKNRGIRLSEKPGFCWSGERWNQEEILSITGIDGALFMDMDGNGLAIGVLVDGEATLTGDVGRGARYNSIVNYVMQKEEGLYIGIIVSEDGMVDIVCNKIKEDAEIMVP